VHYHHSHWSQLVAVAVAARGDSRRYVVTFHGHEILRALDSRIPIVGRLTRWALRQFDDVIAVSDELAGGLRNYVDDRRVRTIPAFLAPGPGEAAALDEDTERFLARASPAVVVSCSRLPSLLRRSDPYGLDLAVTAFCFAARDHPTLGLVVFVGGPDFTHRGRKYLGILTRRVAAAGFSDRFHVVAQAPLAPAFRHDVVYMRPSRTDGDAVSIREALAMDVPVIASDVVGRPIGTVTFPTADVRALTAELQGLLERRAGIRAPAASRERQGDSDRVFERLVAIYRSRDGIAS
jgi:glycosyltransferase involved in cell wall biosynthesis